MKKNSAAGSWTARARACIDFVSGGRAELWRHTGWQTLHSGLSRGVCQNGQLLVGKTTEEGGSQRNDFPIKTANAFRFPVEP